MDTARGLAAVVVVLAFAAFGAAQSPAPSASPASAAPAASPDAGDPDPDSADISFTATVRYKELRFETVGNPKVEFKGGVDAPELGGRSELRSVWHTERINLPTPIQPGVTYRDGGVRLTITTRFDDLDRLLADPAPSPLRPPSPEP